jgi:hypothetical protein
VSPFSYCCVVPRAALFIYPPGATTSGFILPSVVAPPELHFSRCSHIWVTWFTGPEIANFVREKIRSRKDTLEKRYARTFADESGVLQRHFIAQNTSVFYSRHHLLIDTVCACESTVAFVRVALTFFRTVFYFRGLSYMVHFEKKKHDNIFWASLLGHGKR